MFRALLGRRRAWMPMAASRMMEHHGDGADGGARGVEDRRREARLAEDGLVVLDGDPGASDLDKCSASSAGSTMVSPVMLWSFRRSAGRHRAGTPAAPCRARWRGRA